MSKTSVQSPAAYVRDMVLAKVKTHALGVFAELQIADHLARGPRTVASLAAAAGAHAPSLGRLLRLLAAVEIVAPAGPESYQLTEAGQFLRSDVPGSLRGIAAMFGGEVHSRAWASLNHSVLTGTPAFDHVFGAPIFDYLSEHPEPAAMFDDAMTSSSAGLAASVVEAYDFTGISQLVDVGGGHGNLLATVLQRTSDLRGVLFDLPHVMEGAGPDLTEAGVRERVEIVSGDFLASLPAGADAYIMMRIIHDWDDARAATILRNCREGLQPGGRVLVVDAVVDDTPASVYAKMLDIEMLVLTPFGKERTEREFRELFASAGLRLQRIVGTASPLAVLEARAI